MIEIKTYAVRGLLEWNALLPAGRAMVRIPFTGGKLGNTGISPATFSSGNPALQMIIESSHAFRSGKIVIYGTPVKIADGCCGNTATTVHTTPDTRQQCHTSIGHTTDEEDDRPTDTGAVAPDGRGPEQYNQC